MDNKLKTRFKIVLFDLLSIFGGILSFMAMLDSPQTERVEILLSVFSVVGFAVFYNFVCTGCYEIGKYFIEMEKRGNNNEE